MSQAHHPGITDKLLFDGGLAGGLVAAGFLLMGLIGEPEAKPFLIGAAVLGVALGMTQVWGSLSVTSLSLTP